MPILPATMQRLVIIHVRVRGVLSRIRVITTYNVGFQIDYVVPHGERDQILKSEVSRSADAVPISE
jgi:hypothetical protein